MLLSNWRHQSLHPLLSSSSPFLILSFPHPLLSSSSPFLILFFFFWPLTAGRGRAPPPGSHTLQDWRRCLAMFLTVNSLPQNWQLTLLPSPPPPPLLPQPTLFAPYLPLPASDTTQALPLLSDSHPSFASHVQSSQALSSQSSIAHSSHPASLSHHTCSPLASAFPQRFTIPLAPHIPPAFIHLLLQPHSSHPSSTTLSLGSQTATHSPHTLVQSSLCHL